jgi:thioredoxin 1
MANLTEARGENFEQLVLKAQGPVLVDFWATWCSSCIALTPRLEEIAGTLAGKATIVKVNAEECPEIAAQYGVRGLPALLFFKNGQIVNSLSGNQSKAVIQSTLEQLV